MYRAALLALFLSACSSSAQLFNGHDLSGWYSQGDAQWQVQNQEVVGGGEGNGEGDGFLVSHATYKNFEIELEFYVDAVTNSGIFIRCQERDKIDPDTCYELNIWDQHPRQEARTGSVVMRVMPPLAQVHTIGQWNTYRIRVQGELLEVWVNETMTAKLETADLGEGFIALQRRVDGTVRFRNVRLREI